MHLCALARFFGTLKVCMLDLTFVRNNLALVEEKLRLRGMDPAEA